MDSNRDETAAERYDRNWLDLIQEPRVAQTGVQVLAGFLLTVPFSFGFKDIANYERVLFLVAVGLAMLTIGLMIAPVAMHRLLFGRRKRRPRQGRGPHRQVRAGLTWTDPGRGHRLDLQCRRRPGDRGGRRTRRAGVLCVGLGGTADEPAA